VLDLAGIDVAGSVDGLSRAAALRQPASFPVGNVTVEWNDPEQPEVSGRSRVTSDRWKLNLYVDDRPELFDLNTDPGEQHNLAGNPAHLDRVRRLTDELRVWQQSTRDTLPLKVA
jgi:choline-sulfatase